MDESADRYSPIRRHSGAHDNRYGAYDIRKEFQHRDNEPGSRRVNFLTTTGDRTPKTEGPQFSYTPSGPTSMRNRRNAIPTGDSIFDESRVGEHEAQLALQDTPSRHRSIAPSFEQTDTLQGLDHLSLLIERARLESIAAVEEDSDELPIYKLGLKPPPPEFYSGSSNPRYLWNWLSWVTAQRKATMRACTTRRYLSRTPLSTTLRLDKFSTSQRPVNASRSRNGR